MNTTYFSRVALSAIAAVIITACGGGGSGGTAPDDGVGAYVVGTAASGAPKAGAAVSVSDASGRSAAGGTLRVNVTPLTDAIVAMASSDGRSPSEFDDAVKLAAIDMGRMARARTAMQTTIGDLTAALGDPAFDPLTSSFATMVPSVGEVLLQTVKVDIGSSGVSLRTIASTTDGEGVPADSVVTITDVATQSGAALPVLPGAVDMPPARPCTSTRCLAQP